MIMILFIKYYPEIMNGVKTKITANQKRLKEVESYGEDGEELKSPITNELARLNKYLQELESQLSRTTSLKFLFTLKSGELYQEAVKNKSSALLIIQSPELIKKIPNYQIAHVTHQDSEMIQLVASILVSREYTFELPNIFAALKQQVTAESDQNFIKEKENQVIRKLLLKINSYLDHKIEQALKGNTNPWALGYFGSRYKLNQGDKKVSVPQGIYELKEQLNQLEKFPQAKFWPICKPRFIVKQKKKKTTLFFKSLNVL